jgi:hypothetical protein
MVDQGCPRFARIGPACSLRNLLPRRRRAQCFGRHARAGRRGDHDPQPPGQSPRVCLQPGLSHFHGPGRRGIGYTITGVRASPKCCGHGLSEC